MDKNEIVIRRATIGDLKTIQELNNELFKLEKENFDSTLIDNWPISKDGEKYFSDLIKYHYVLIAEVNEEVVGYLVCSINEKVSYEKIQYGELNNMFIKKQFRGLGIGRKLINTFINYCKNNNINDIKVNASYKNVNAIKFYKIMGFSEFDLTLTMHFD